MSREHASPTERFDERLGEESMFRHLRIRRWLCRRSCCRWPPGRRSGRRASSYDRAGPSCPTCSAPGSPPCPANVKYFGYYPTRWRTMARHRTRRRYRAEQARPNHVEVPPADQEAVGKPGGTSGDTGTANPPATGSTTDPNSSNTPQSRTRLPPRRCADAERTAGTQRMPVAKQRARSPNGDAAQRRRSSDTLPASESARSGGQEARNSPARKAPATSRCVRFLASRVN